MSAAYHGVMGGYTLLATLVAGSCLCATLAVLTRDIARELIAEITFDAKRPPGR